MFPFVTCDLVLSQAGKRTSFELSFFISLLLVLFTTKNIFFLDIQECQRRRRSTGDTHHTPPLSSFSVSYICACSTQILLYKKIYGLLLHASEICTYIK